MKVRLLISAVLFASFAAIGCKGGDDTQVDAKQDNEFQKQLADAAASSKGRAGTNPGKRGALPDAALQHKDDKAPAGDPPADGAGAGAGK